MSRMAEVDQAEVDQAEEVAYCEMEEVEVYRGTWVVDGRISGDMTTWSKVSSLEECQAGERCERTDLLFFVLGISESN